jgi:hypothetical protein
LPKLRSPKLTSILKRKNADARLSMVLAAIVATASPAVANMDGKNCDNVINGPSNCDECLTTDNREDGKLYCVKDGKGLSQKQIDAWYLEEGKRLAEERAAALFPVTPEQYSRMLQLMKAKGLFSKYSHSCEMQTDGTGYLCNDSLNDISIMYYAAEESARINHIAVGANPGDTLQAASIAAVAALSLNKKYLKIQSGTPAMAAAFGTLRDIIQNNMERIFVRGGSSFDNTDGAFLLYSINNNKSMAIVAITPFK